MNSLNIDEKSDPNNPRWFLVDVIHKKDFWHQVSLEEMKVLQKGNRLSITPVSENEYKAVCAAGL